MSSRNACVLILAGLVGVVFCASVWVLWGSELWALIDVTMTLLREAGPVVFFGAMALLPLMGFPLSPFTLAAGPVFAPQMGAGWVIVCAMGALTVNVSLSYWLASRALRPLVLWGLEKWGKTMPDVASRSAWDLTVVLRVLPGTPFFVQSYLLGVARVSFGIYIFVSVLVPSVYVTVIVLAGDALSRGDQRTLGIAGTILAVVGVSMHFLRGKILRKLRERREAMSSL